jgi:hypothetical protein
MNKFSPSRVIWAACGIVAAYLLFAVAFTSLSVLRELNHDDRTAFLMLGGILASYVVFYPLAGYWLWTVVDCVSQKPPAHWHWLAILILSAACGFLAFNMLGGSVAGATAAAAYHLASARRARGSWRSTIPWLKR